MTVIPPGRVHWGYGFLGPSASDTTDLTSGEGCQALPTGAPAPEKLIEPVCFQLHLARRAVSMTKLGITYLPQRFKGAASQELPQQRTQGRTTLSNGPALTLAHLGVPSVPSLEDDAV